MATGVVFGAFVPQGWKMELSGIDSAEAKWAKAVEVAQLAEQLGYDSVWLYDHVHNVPRPAHEAVFECWTTIAAISQVTSRVDPSSPNRGIRDVSGNRHDTTPLLSEPIAGAAERLLVPSSNDEVVASLGQHAGNHLAEPAAGAGHDCHPILFSHVHSFEKARPKDAPYNRLQLQVHLKSRGKCGKLRRGGSSDPSATMSDVLTISEVARRSGVAWSASCSPRACWRSRATTAR